jgi:DNA-binding IclR family transcriptional regulator
MVIGANVARVPFRGQGSQGVDAPSLPHRDPGLICARAVRAGSPYPGVVPQRAAVPHGEAPVNGRPGRIQSIDRAVALLRAIAVLPPEQATLQRIAAQVGLNRSTAWRIIATLEDNGLVERRDGGYAVGMAAAQFSNAASVDGFMRRAKPVLQTLAESSGECSNLAVVRRFGLYYVDQASSSPEVVEDWLGRQVPLHATSAGKAYLSALTDAEVLDLLPARLHRYTRTTITSRDVLIEQLHEARQCGYARVMGELETESNGVAAAVCDAGGRPVAAVTLWGQAERVPFARLAPLGALVIEAAATLQTLVSPVEDA